MNHAIREAYQRARTKQADSRGKTITPFDDAVAGAVQRAAELAMQDRKKERRAPPVFRVCSAPTGSGKSSFAYAFAAAMLETDPDFSCAFVVETQVMVQETYDNLCQLIEPSLVLPWSTAHNSDTPLEEALEEMNLSEEDEGPTRKTNARSELKEYRVVVATHEGWRRELRGTAGPGIRYFGKEKRSLVFIDERPKLEDIVEVAPHEIVKLRDLMPEEDPKALALARIVKRMETALETSSRTYAAVTLVRPEEGKLFERFNSETAKALIPRASSMASADLQREALGHERVGEFLKLAACGYLFLSRNGGMKTFWAYDPGFRPDPGTVILDATADLEGLVLLNKDMKSVDVPKADFSRLTVKHLEEPSEFKFKPKLYDRRTRAQKYADWMLATTLENTKPGDNVLLITHKQFITGQAVMPSAFHWEERMDWHGRSLNVIWWGTGIGSSAWKRCNVVMAFGEHYLGGDVMVAKALAATKRRASDEELTAAHKTGEDPRGIFLTATDGHLLRWQVQLAARGTMRNLDGAGQCGEMTLITTMKFDRLMRHFGSMFPGAAPPLLLSNGEEKEGGTAGLAKLLAETDRNILTSEEVEELTGVPSGNLKARTQAKKVSTVMEVYGWELATARSVGLPGKRKVLVRRPSVLSMAAE